MISFSRTYTTRMSDGARVSSTAVRREGVTVAHIEGRRIGKELNKFIVRATTGEQIGQHCYSMRAARDIAIKHYEGSDQ